MKRIPIKALKEFANKYNLSQLIIVGQVENSNTQHVATWGKTLRDCEIAAISGNNLKKHMGWPNTLCHSTPSRLKKKGITL